MKSKEGIINIAIVALVLGLILLSIGVYMTQNKAPTPQGIKQETTKTSPTDNETGSAETASEPAYTPTNPAKDTEIETKMQELINSEKEVTNTFSDKPIDVTAE